MDATTYDTEFGQRAFSQVLDIWVTPEVERRQAAGTLPKRVELIAAQVIFYPDQRPREVRINSEVQGVGDPDCGHITIIRINDSWKMSFDCIYNKELSESHIQVADQFLATAEHALNNEYWSPFVDSLFSAAELLAKSILLGSWSDPKFREKANHRSIHSRFNRWAHLGNAEQSHANALNQLSQLRGSARYLTGDLFIDRNQAVEWLNTVRELRESAFQNARIGSEW